MRKPLPVAVALVAAGLLTPTTPARANLAEGETAYGLFSANQLVSLDTTAPGRLSLPVPITGLADGEELKAIDVRPATGGLYALGGTGRLYVIAPATAKATQVGTGTFAVPLRGAEFDIDFNPTVDRLRLVSDGEQNLRLNPNDGTVVDADAMTDGLQVDGDVNGAAATAADQQVVAAAYRNAFAPTTTTAGATTLFTIDAASDRQFVQDPPNAGTQSSPTPLGIDVDATTGLDVAGSDNTAYLLATVAGTRRLYGYKPAPTAAKPVALGDVAPQLEDIAIARQAPTLVGLGADGASLTLLGIPTGAATTTAVQAFTQTTPVPVTGLQMGETLVGIDVRPATGELYGVGSTSRLYKLDPSTGVATAVGAGPFTPALNGTQFDIDFNPNVDRLRLVSSDEQNLRINPNDGTVVDGNAMTAGVQGDGNLNRAGLLQDPGVSGAAYTLNFPGPTTGTRLIDLDVDNDSLYTQTPPNDGTLTGATGLTGQVTDVDVPVGLDIAGQDGAVALSATTGATGRVGRVVDLGTGEVVLQGAAPATAIRDLTTVSAGLISFGPATLTVPEGGTVSLRLRRTDVLPGIKGTATVRVRAVGGSAQLGADVPGFDLALTFPEGVDELPLLVPITDDTTKEDAESFVIAIDRAAGGYRLGDTTQTITVPANDGAGGTPAPKRPRPAATLRVTPKRDRTAPYRFSFAVEVRRPAAAPAVGCRSKLRVQLKNSARKVIKTRTVTVGTSCRASGTVTVNTRARFGRTGKARITARYLGNGSLAPRTAASKVVRLG